MAGCMKIFILDAMIKGLRSHCFRYKTVTVSAVSLHLSGLHHHHLTSTRKTILLSSLTSTDTDPSQLIREEMQSDAGKMKDHISDIGQSYQHSMNHLMLIEHAGHGQIILVTESQLIVIV